MYFPVADIECTPLLPFGVAALISFFTSMGGISGAFLLLPFQMSVLGYVNPGVSATNQLFNIMACPAGIWRYWREGRLLWPVALTIAAGTLPGVFLGAVIRIMFLPDPGQFKVFAGVVLLFIGGRVACSMRGGAHSSLNLSRKGTVKVTSYGISGMSFTFQGGQYDLSTKALLLLSMAVGLVGGIYGIGGGAIMAPFLISFFGIPVYVTAGATLMATALTSLAGVLFFSLLSPLYPNLSVAPDWRLGLLIGCGGMLGMYFGARCQKFVPDRIIKLVLAVVLLCVAFCYMAW
ncbi:MAG: sulfite exporter TauE/SafE family protein [Mailhella sp.]|nr:sulfite exporter TauE/SafE family protein [Mailhella sp.]